MSDKLPYVGRAIFPQDLDRVLGRGFTSISHIVIETGMDENRARAFLKEMTEEGELELWAASKCPTCDFAWPLFPNNSIIREDMGVVCPLCNDNHLASEMVYYRVYKYKD